MRRVLPGGAVLNGDAQRAVACRPGAAVVESVRRPRPPSPLVRLLSAARRLPGRWRRFWSVERLSAAKLFLEVLVVLVGLVGAVLALLGWSRN
jgi:hypothetical protein